MRDTGIWWKFPSIYFAFGGAYAAVMFGYCSFRARAGNPSDLPCLSPLWTPMFVAGWPLMALDQVVVGDSVLVPPLLVRAVGVAFLGGFILALVWLFRRPPRPTCPR